MPAALRVGFAGTPDFAKVALAALLAAGHTVPGTRVDVTRSAVAVTAAGCVAGAFMVPPGLKLSTENAA